MVNPPKIRMCFVEIWYKPQPSRQIQLVFSLMRKLSVSQFWRRRMSYFSIRFVRYPPLKPATTYKAWLSKAMVVWKLRRVLRFEICVQVSVVTSYTSHLFIDSLGSDDPIA